MIKKKGFLLDIFDQADPILLALCAGTTLFGILMISSATHYMHSWKYVIVQCCAMLIGIVLYFLISMVDLNELAKKWKWILGFNIGFFLLLKTPLGVEAGGNRAWLGFDGFPVNIQPAEIVKMTFILLLAKQLVYLKEHRDLKSIPSIGMLVGHLGLIVGLYYVISDDMGSALVYIFAFACMAFVAGVALRWFAIGLAAGGLGFYILWNEDKVNDYMKERFAVLFDHTLDPQGAGWQQTRGLLTLGGGKLTGQGLFHGTQTQSQFSGSLPARHTDFIFAVIGEELGMLGCLFTIALLAAIVIRCLVIARNAKTRMDAYICVGVAATLIFQILANIGMCLFVMPVIGLTLPFISYGGSSIVTLYMAMGMVSGISKRTPPDWLR